MYDRKTWIVVIACSILLAVNINLQQKNARAVAEQKQRETPVESTPADPAAAPAAAPGAEVRTGSLATEEPPSQLVEQV